MANDRPSYRPGDTVVITNENSPHAGTAGVVSFEKDDGDWPIIVEFDGEQVVFHADDLKPQPASEAAVEELGEEQADLARNIVGAEVEGDTAGEVIENADQPVEG